MATRKAGPGDVFPGGGVDGEVAFVDTTAGTVQLSFGDSADVNYTPDEDTDWDVVPSKIAAALDELAARVKVLEP